MHLQHLANLTEEAALIRAFPGLPVQVPKECDIPALGLDGHEGVPPESLGFLGSKFSCIQTLVCNPPDSKILSSFQTPSVTLSLAQLVFFLAARLLITKNNMS
jgi:hypothetical protein